MPKVKASKKKSKSAKKKSKQTDTNPSYTKEQMQTMRLQKHRDWLQRMRKAGMPEWQIKQRLLEMEKGMRSITPKGK